MSKPVRLSLALSLAVAGAASLGGCAGYGPLGEPPHGVAGLKAAEQQHNTARIGQPGLTPRGGGSAIAPTGRTATRRWARRIPSGRTDFPRPLREREGAQRSWEG